MGNPITVEDTKVCLCGAEWESAKVLVEEEDTDENFDLLPCGCFEDHGCSCPEDFEILYEEED
jgi:hypothetical protein